MKRAIGDKKRQYRTLPGANNWYFAIHLKILIFDMTISIISVESQTNEDRIIEKNEVKAEPAVTENGVSVFFFTESRIF